MPLPDGWQRTGNGPPRNEGETAIEGRVTIGRRRMPEGVMRQASAGQRPAAGVYPARIAATVGAGVSTRTAAGGAATASP